MRFRFPSTRHRIGHPLRIAAGGFVLALLLLAMHAPGRWVAIELPVSLAFLILGISDTLAPDRKMYPPDGLAPLIALVGCDGSGKSTLAADLEVAIAPNATVARCYLGLGSGELGLRIKRLPLIGPAVEHYLSRKASQTRDKTKTVPGLATALVVFAFSLLRYRRFRRALLLRRQGVTVITDRYPQTEVAGMHDGPGLSAATAGSATVAWLARQERRMYERMASFHPDVVLRLNVDAATALARKPDHKAGLLAAKIAAAPLLRFDGAHMVDIDARQSYDAVRSKALASVAPILQPAARPVMAAA